MIGKKTIVTLLFVTLLLSCIVGCSNFSQAVSTDTMGNTVTGSTNYAGTSQETGSGTYGGAAGTNVARCNSIVASEGGTIVSIGLSVNSAAGDVMLAIYADSGSNTPGALLGYTDPVTVVTGWNDIELIDPVAVSAGETYWLAYEATSTSLRINLAFGGSQYTVSATYGSFPDPFGSTTTTYWQCVYRMTYSASPTGSALATQVELGSCIASLQSVSFYSSAKGFLRLALYSHDGVTSGPGDLLWQSSSDAVAVGWNTIPIAAGEPATVRNLYPGTYWLAFQWGSSTSGPNMISGDVGTGNSMAMSYGAFPAVWDGGSSTSTQWSVYATYNVLATITPVPTAAPSSGEASSEDTGSASETTPAPTATPTLAPADTAIATRTTDNAVFDVPVTGDVAASQISGLMIRPSESDQTTQVAFTLTGTSGDSGSFTMTLPKQAIPFGTVPVVYIDGVQAQDQSYTEDAQNFYITCTTHFSTHDITIVFISGSAQTPIGIDTTSIIVIAGVVAALVIVAVAVLVLRSRKSS